MEEISICERPVAVIDSGMGGISVLRVLREVLPRENYIYFGDSANAPYGEKSGEEVKAITEKNISMLLSKGAKAIVIACNTATSVAADHVRKKYAHIPIIGMEPAIKPAAMCAEHPAVLVMATPLTLKKEKFLSLMDKYAHRADFINVPCHGLVELVERGITEGKEMDAFLSRLLAPYVEGRRIDAVVLGCTHYLHVSDAIAKALGGNVQIFDGALGTAKETERRLAALGILNFSKENGKLAILNSSDDPKFIELSNKLLDR